MRVPARVRMALAGPFGGLPRVWPLHVGPLSVGPVCMGPPRVSPICMGPLRMSPICVGP